MFDLDGTLVDSAPDLHHCTNILMDELGLPALDLETVTGFIGHGVGPLVASALAHNNLPLKDEALAQMIARFTDIYAADPAKFCQPFEGVMDTLTILKSKGHKMAICTNKAIRLARLVVDALGLDEFCPVLIGGDSLPYRKPAPVPVYECLRLLQHTTGEAYLYVGDSETDAKTAENANTYFFLHSKGYRKKTVDELYHTDVFDHWGHFIPKMNALNL